MMIECLVMNSLTSELAMGADAGDSIFEVGETYSEVDRDVVSSVIEDSFPFFFSFLSFFKSVSSRALSPVFRFGLFFVVSAAEAMQFLSLRNRYLLRTDLGDYRPHPQVPYTVFSSFSSFLISPDQQFW